MFQFNISLTPVFFFICTFYALVFITSHYILKVIHCGTDVCLPTLNLKKKITNQLILVKQKWIRTQ